jgi:hypothetical protein
VINLYGAEHKRLLMGQLGNMIDMVVFEAVVLWL